MQAGRTVQEAVKQQKRMEVMRKMMKKMRAQGRMDAQNSWCISDMLAAFFFLKKMCSTLF